MGTYKKSEISPIQIKPKSKGSGSGEAGEPGDQSGEPGDQTAGAPGQGGINQKVEPSKSPLDKSIEDKLAKRKDVDSKQVNVDKATQQSKPSADTGQGKASDLTASNVVYKPAFSWKELIRQFVASQSTPETTYTKPSTRSITQINIAKQLGSAAIKPGEKPGEEVFKLLMVFDTSGSMYGTIGAALGETRALLTKMSTTADSAMGITFFADQPIFFAADLKNGKAWQVSSFDQMTKKVPNTAKQPLTQILRSSMSGGTTFNASLAGELSSMASKGYNIIMFSDTDVAHGENWTNFVNLYKAHKQRFFFIADSSRSYNYIVKQLGVQPRTFGHL